MCAVSLIPFTKMNGLGNDFIVVDARENQVKLDADDIAMAADRQNGIGCDQFITLENSADADVFMRINNADGGEVAACGNATRCIADILLKEKDIEQIKVETNAGILVCWRASDQMVTVDMGEPKFQWHQIPLAEEFADTRSIELQIGPIDAPILHTPSVVNVGNPHAIFWVDDIEAVDLSRSGPLLETHPIFPERANISLAKIVSDDEIILKTWERGVGLTNACGTAACAATVCAIRKGLTKRNITVHLPGGPLQMSWADNNHIHMTGPFAYEFNGTLQIET